MKILRDNNIYIARAPLQLFNCIEAKNRFGTDTENTAVIMFRNDVDRKLMLQLIDPSEWSDIIVVDTNTVVNQIRLLLRLKQMDRIRNIYLGDYIGAINIFLNSVACDKIIFVDDGTATLERARHLANGDLIRMDKWYRKKSPSAIFFGRLTRTDLSYFKRIGFFTIYRDLAQLLPGYDVTINDYTFARRHYAALPRRDVVFFIGSPIERYFLKSPDLLEGYISALSEHYAGRKWTYILHRKDDVEKYANLAEKYNFEIVKFDNILETQFLTQGWVPAEIGTFLSSALDTLHLLCSCRLRAFSLRSEDLVNHRIAGIEAIYRQYEERGIQVETIT